VKTGCCGSVSNFIGADRIRRGVSYSIPSGRK
jgi:hypothetical protein